MTSAVRVRLSDRAATKLNALADRLAETPEAVAARAVELYLADEDWRVAEIEAALREAEAGDFASETEIAAAFSAARGGARE